MEHVKIADRGAVILLKILRAGRGRDEKLFSGTSSQFTAALKAITDFFGISNRDGVGITWSSFRAGRATHTYIIGWDVAKIMWEGRWAAVATLNRYIQELAATSLESELDVASRLLLDAFAEGLTASVSQLLLTRAPHFVTYGGGAS